MRTRLPALSRASRRIAPASRSAWLVGDYAPSRGNSNALRHPRCLFPAVQPEPEGRPAEGAEDQPDPPAVLDFDPAMERARLLVARLRPELPRRSEAHRDTGEETAAAVGRDT